MILSIINDNFKILNSYNKLKLNNSHNDYYFNKESNLNRQDSKLKVL